MATSSHILNKSASSRRTWPLGENLQAVRRHLAEDGKAAFVGVEASARSFTLARLWLANPCPWLIVYPTSAMAESAYRDLDFFIGAGARGLSPVRLYPPYEGSLFQPIVNPPELTARRLSILWELLSYEGPLLVVTSVRGLPARLCPPEFLVDNALSLTVGSELARDELVDALGRTGYTPMSLVEQPGDFALRGSVVDFFGPLAPQPVRVEFDDDRIASLRFFDPNDQRSQFPIAETLLIPCQPVDLSPDAVAGAVKELKNLAGKEGWGARRVAEYVERMELRVPFAGLDSLLPLYYVQAGDLFDYLPADTLRVIVEPMEVHNRLQSQHEELEEQYQAVREEGMVALPPARLRRTPGQMLQRLRAGKFLLSRALNLQNFSPEAAVWQAPQLEIPASIHPGLYQELSKGGEGSLLDQFMLWVARIREQGRAVVLICRSASQIDRLREIFDERSVQTAVLEDPGENLADFGFDKLLLARGALSTGFTPRDLPVTFVTEDEVFGAPKVVRQKAPAKLSEMLAALDDLTPGDLVVHVDHGIARYEGLVTLAVGAAESDFLLLVYQGGDNLYLPADRMGLISKYRGPSDVQPALDRLGGKAWVKAKSRAKKAVEAIARDLVELYAARRIQQGHAYSPPDSAYREFEAGFPYVETPDQMRAIEDVLADLMAPRPMDRLICGDVGFGKTEIALRAAFLVASQGRQAVVLVPTTVLAEQHYQTFSDRLKDHPLIVESLSRFRTPKKQKRILEDLAAGKVDIVIGTHRLLQKDVVFKELGLLVVDEEQRFGVRDKERLKQLRKNVDSLALSATPIPRTMQMSLSGIRDLSIIKTPPADRQAIETFVSTFSPVVLAEAINRELERQGQVYFIHNRVQDIARMARMVKELCPQARLGIAHGQMSERALEKVMMDFVRGQLDVLVCTTIVESGLDITPANTIIINQADKLGLSQIYQLRGRVGRAGAKAYAYLLVQSETSLSRDAAKRLKVLMDFTHLGAGFQIALHDLEIRGAGNLLGEVQSGQVAEVGYELYVRMLEEAVAMLKGDLPELGPEPEFKLALKANLPESYVPDTQVRLSLYKRLSMASEPGDVQGIKNELYDRFGDLPVYAQNLLDVVELKNICRRMFINAMEINETFAHIHFIKDEKVNVSYLIDKAQKNSDKITIYPQGVIRFKLAGDIPALVEVKDFLQSIRGDGN